jgi:hypothetical protein
MDAKPRASADILLALHSTNEQADAFARQMLDRGGRVHVVAFDATSNEREQPSCVGLDCSEAISRACTWAAEQGLDYYALARYFAEFSSQFKCTKHARAKLFDKNEPECVDGVETDQSSVARFTLDIYEVADCTNGPWVNVSKDAWVHGEKAVSLPAAEAQLLREMDTAKVLFPDQIRIVANGRVVTTDRQGDGLFTLFRGGKFRNLVRITGGGTQPETIEPLECCVTPSAGDVLVRRSGYQYLELAVPINTALLTRDNTREAVWGIGAHLRYYPLEGGFQASLGADLTGNSGQRIVLFSGEVGWGIRFGRRLFLSANVGGGVGRADEAVPAFGQIAFAPHAIANVRVIAHLIRWLYVGADLGYLHSATYDDWTGDGAAVADDLAFRTPFARVFLGFY